MQLKTEYRIYFLNRSTAPTNYRTQYVLERNQDASLNMPATFASEEDALGWLESQDPIAVNHMGDIVILPVRRMGY